MYLEISRDTKRFTSIGKAVHNANICIVDELGNELETGQKGRLCISGKMLMKGYFEEEELTKEVLIEDRFYTSDVGYMDQDGFIFLMGRSQDVMSIGGEKVSPFEIEDVAYEMDCVKECACVAIKDPEAVRGEVPVLFLSVRKGMDYSQEKLRKQFEKKLERFKQPYQIFVIDEIPKNALGKTDRNVLRKMARSECSGRNVQ